MTSDGRGAMRSFRRSSDTGSQPLRPGIVRRIFRFIAPYRGQIAVFLVLIVFDALVLAATPLIYRQIIDVGIATGDAALVI